MDAFPGTTQGGDNDGDGSAGGRRSAGETRDVAVASEHAQTSRGKQCRTFQDEGEVAGDARRLRK